MGASLVITPGRKEYMFIEFIPNVSNRESLVYMEDWGTNKGPT